MKPCNAVLDLSDSSKSELTFQRMIMNQFENSVSFFPVFLPPRVLVGEGNGTPLQYSCLESPMDGGAW